MAGHSLFHYDCFLVTIAPVQNVTFLVFHKTIFARNDNSPRLFKKTLAKWQCFVHFLLKSVIIEMTFGRDSLQNDPRKFSWLANTVVIALCCPIHPLFPSRVTAYWRWVSLSYCVLSWQCLSFLKSDVVVLFLAPTVPWWLHHARFSPFLGTPKSVTKLVSLTNLVMLLGGPTIISTCVSWRGHDDGAALVLVFVHFLCLLGLHLSQMSPSISSKADFWPLLAGIAFWLAHFSVFVTTACSVAANNQPGLLFFLLLVFGNTDCHNAFVMFSPVIQCSVFTTDCDRKGTMLSINATVLLQRFLQECSLHMSDPSLLLEDLWASGAIRLCCDLFGVPPPQSVSYDDVFSGWILYESSFYGKLLTTLTSSSLSLLSMYMVSSECETSIKNPFQPSAPDPTKSKHAIFFLSVVLHWGAAQMPPYPETLSWSWTYLAFCPCAHWSHSKSPHWSATLLQVFGEIWCCCQVLLPQVQSTRTWQVPSEQVMWGAWIGMEGWQSQQFWQSSSWKPSQMHYSFRCSWSCWFCGCRHHATTCY